MTTISIKKSLQSVFTLLILLLLPVSVSAQELDQVILKQDLHKILRNYFLFQGGNNNKERTVSGGRKRRNGNFILSLQQ
ncbi:hypothetical protein DRF60_18290 [Chryseobacterium elymi]|uniref:Uncharacterized protein n=1 Tax=Chryseobacterium elymi TaxID=395936 RepID=A0A3D9D7U5_9FLAO|nr:hypothetical protein [Chryseobacterium elymi]REC74027.1 hypothetical protein DRF60_18290 [Chryseobacterium elymi]